MMTNLDELLDEAKWDGVSYFNLEISPEGTAIVFNASKKGLDSFLKAYGNLEFPPAFISFVESRRPSRRWVSWEVKDNEEASVTDPSPYLGIINDHVWNDLMATLHFHFLEKDEGESILSAGMGGGKIILFVNKKGWQNFLKLLRCLRHKSYWFYITPPNPKFVSQLPFQMNIPYPGDPEDHVFKAIEFIRLEADDKIRLDLNSSSATVLGNSGGWFLFAQWMRSFAMSQRCRKISVIDGMDHIKA